MIRMLVAAFAALTVSVAAHAQEPDPERLELAYEVMELSNAAELGRDALELTLPTLRALVETQFPNASPDQVDQAMTLLTDTMMNTLPQVVDASANLYAERFTAEELSALIAFYQTPAGQKLIAEQPAMLQEISVISEQLGLQAVNSVAAELAEILQ